VQGATRRALGTLPRFALEAGPEEFDLFATWAGWFQVPTRRSSAAPSRRALALLLGRIVGAYAGDVPAQRAQV
jgi:hypothetical protein